MANADQTSDMSEAARRYTDKLLAVSALVLLLVGTVVFGALEDWGWVDSMYFSVIAVTTVGFGDLSPTTDASKLFCIVYVLSGIAIISMWLNERLRRHGIVARRRRDRES